MLLPTIQIPELDNKSEEEQKSILAIYIMQFGRLDYQIALRALDKITHDENKMKELSKAPIPTIAREIVNYTEFEKEEKEKYKLSKQIRYYVDTEEHMMRACNALRTSERLSEYDKPFNTIEEDFYINQKMSLEEYNYWQDIRCGRETKKPDYLCYDPTTRTNTLDINNISRIIREVKNVK